MTGADGRNSRVGAGSSHINKRASWRSPYLDLGTEIFLVVRPGLTKAYLDVAIN